MFGLRVSKLASGKGGQFVAWAKRKSGQNPEDRAARSFMLREEKGTKRALVPTPGTSAI